MVRVVVSFAGEFAQGIHAGHLGHGEVEQQDIGLQRAHHVQRFNTVFRFGDDLHLAVGLQHITQPNSNYGMIVGNQDLNGRHQYDSPTAKINLATLLNPQPETQTGRAFLPTRLHGIKRHRGLVQQACRLTELGVAPHQFQVRATARDHSGPHDQTAAPHVVCPVAELLAIFLRQRGAQLRQQSAGLRAR